MVEKLRPGSFQGRVTKSLRVRFASRFRRSEPLLKALQIAGTFEIDNEGTGGGILETTRHLRDVLLAKGYDVQYKQFTGGHDGLSWRGTLADGLMALLGVR